MGYTLGNDTHLQAYNDGHDLGVQTADMVEWDDDMARRFLHDEDDDSIEPPSPLSGEWGGGPFLTDIARTYGVALESEELSDICDAYEAGYYEGFHDHATELAHDHLVW